ncbi:hypothetical protein I4U23_007240 [Adineta vaga]|nr:hypothetical protein I4U23_007240 [Adineta vaga]
MNRRIFILFIFQIVFNIHYSTHLTYFESATYVSADSSNAILYNVTCSECICRAFFSNHSSSHEAIACYEYNYTCLLFSNYVSRSNIRIDPNAKLIFIQTSATTIATCNNIYNQCGGNGWNGTTNCCSGLSCVYKNSSYSQCLLSSTVTTVLTTTESPITTTYFNDSRQNTSTSTYWDCCKLSCGWPYKASVTNPARTCTQDGNTTIDSNTQSYCNGGSSYMCTDQQPWNVSSDLSYGYAGGSISGQSEWNWCCACYSLLFTSGPVVGKEFIVQVINSASTTDNTFILQIPGSGWGYSSNGCSQQFGGSYLWGNQFGGLTNRANCSNLPIVLRRGCYWRFDWFMNANNPSARFKQVSCPTALTDKTGCVRV